MVLNKKRFVIGFVFAIIDSLCCFIRETQIFRSRVSGTPGFIAVIISTKLCIKCLEVNRQKLLTENMFKSSIYTVKR